MSEYCFDMAWREFSHRARAQQGNRAGIRYYAEKHMDTRKLDLAELPPVKVIVLLRDPRDTYISIRAFDRKRRESGHKGPTMWPEDSKSREDRLDWFIHRQRDRMRWIHDLLRSDEVPARGWSRDATSARRSSPGDARRAPSTIAPTSGARASRIPRLSAAAGEGEARPMSIQRTGAPSSAHASRSTGSSDPLSTTMSSYAVASIPRCIAGESSESSSRSRGACCTPR